MTFEQSFFVIAWPVLIYSFARILYLDKEFKNKMSQLDTDVQAVSDAEAALEARVTAHENHDTLVAIDLQNQIDSLKANGATPENLKALEDLKTRIDNFDPAVPTP